VDLVEGSATLLFGKRMCIFFDQERRDMKRKIQDGM
jgi:hypothetical protein